MPVITGAEVLLFKTQLLFYYFFSFLFFPFFFGFVPKSFLKLDLACLHRLKMHLWSLISGLEAFFTGCTTSMFCHNDFFLAFSCYPLLDPLPDTHFLLEVTTRRGSELIQHPTFLFRKALRFFILLAVSISTEVNCSLVIIFLCVC